MNVRALVSWLVALTVLAPAALAQSSAQSDADRHMARSLAEEGDAALERGDYQTALDRLTRSQELYPAPTVELRIGLALAGSGKLVSAFETHNRVARTRLGADAPEAFREAVAKAKREAERLEPRIPKVVIRVTGSDAARVTLDGEAIPPVALGAPRPADPGSHAIRAVAPGQPPREVTVVLEEGKTEEIVLELGQPEGSALGPAVAPAPSASSAAPMGADVASEPGSDARRLGWVALGVGAAGLVTGGIAGALFLGERSELDEQCPGDVCPREQEGTLDAYRTLSAVSGIGFAAGVVGAGVGAWLLLTSPSETDEQHTIGAYIGPLSAGVRGKF